MFDYLIPNKTCVLLNNKEIIFSSEEDGVKPLVKYLYSSGIPKPNTILIDKIIGYAIANVVIFCKINTVYTNIISKPALALLNKYGVNTNYLHLVDNILRRDKSDICPMEKKLLTATTPDEAVEFLKQIVIFNNPIHLK